MHGKSLALVFVHLGPPLPKHLVQNINNILEERPDLQIHLITDRSGTNLDPRVEILLADNSMTMSRFRKESTLNNSFRGGFWQLTLLRLSVLAEWHERHPDLGLLHVESDLYLDPSCPIEGLAVQEKLCWIPAILELDLAGFFYSPSPSETAWLIEACFFELSKDRSVTDMQAFYRIRQAHKERIDLFPHFSSSRIECGSGQLSHLFSDWVFDSVGLGMVVFGEDPRNHRGLRVRGRIPDSPYFIGEPWNVRLFVDASDPLTLFCEAQKDAGVKRIATIHMHSKRLFELTKSRREEFLRRTIARPLQFEVLGFDPFAFFSFVAETLIAGRLRAIKFIREKKESLGKHRG